MVAILTRNWAFFFFHLSPCISSLPLSINQSLSLPLCFTFFFLLPFTKILHTTFLQAPFFYQLGFAEAHKSPCWCRITWFMYALHQGLDTIAGYSSTHFTLISTAQDRQSVPRNLRCFFCCCGELARCPFSVLRLIEVWCGFFSVYKEIKEN